MRRVQSKMRKTCMHAYGIVLLVMPRLLFLPSSRKHLHTRIKNTLLKNTHNIAHTTHTYDLLLCVGYDGDAETQKTRNPPVSGRLLLLSTRNKIKTFTSERSHTHTHTLTARISYNYLHTSGRLSQRYPPPPPAPHEFDVSPLLPTVPKKSRTSIKHGGYFKSTSTSKKLTSIRSATGTHFHAAAVTVHGTHHRRHAMCPPV